MQQHAVAPAPGDLLDDHEVARLLSVAVATLRNWRCLGRGPRYVRLGESRMVRYKRADVEAYIRPVDADSRSATHGPAHAAA